MQCQVRNVKGRVGESAAEVRDESPLTCYSDPAERERNLLLLFFTAKADFSSVAAATSSE
jgi:hypothetical protein